MNTEDSTPNKNIYVAEQNGWNKVICELVIQMFRDSVTEGESHSKTFRRRKYVFFILTFFLIVIAAVAGVFSFLNNSPEPVEGKFCYCPKTFGEKTFKNFEYDDGEWTIMITKTDMENSIAMFVMFSYISGSINVLSSIIQSIMSFWELPQKMEASRHAANGFFNLGRRIIQVIYTNPKKRPEASKFMNKFNIDFTNLQEQSGEATDSSVSLKYYDRVLQLIETNKAFPSASSTPDSQEGLNGDYLQMLISDSNKQSPSQNSRAPVTPNSSPQTDPQILTVEVGD